MGGGGVIGAGLSDEEELEVGEREDLEVSFASLLKREDSLWARVVSLNFLALRAEGRGVGWDASVHCTLSLSSRGIFWPFSEPLDLNIPFSLDHRRRQKEDEDEFAPG